MESIAEENIGQNYYQEPQLQAQPMQFAPLSPGRRPSAPLFTSGIGLPQGVGLGRPLHCSGIGMPRVNGLGALPRPLFASGVFSRSQFAGPALSPRSPRMSWRGGPFGRSPLPSPNRYPVRPPPPPMSYRPGPPPNVINCARPGMPWKGRPLVKAAVPQIQVPKPNDEVSYVDVPFEKKVVEYVPVEHTIQDFYTIENRTSYVPTLGFQPKLDVVGVNSLVPVTTNVTGEQTFVHGPQSPVSLGRKLSQGNLFASQNNQQIYQQENNVPQLYSSPSRTSVKGTFSRDVLHEVNGIKRGGVYSPTPGSVNLRKNKFDSLN